METSGYHLLLPEGTLDYFIISDVKESSTEIVIYLEEKNEVPGEYSSMQVESKGFYEPVVVQDFPIRGKKLFLNIRRRRWIVKDEGRYVSRNWKLVAEGSRMTHDFASFLKELYARWEALDEESIQMAHARACGKIYHAPVFENGDSRKQLLARSIYLLYKKESLWTESQRVRAGILFREYPDIKKAYYLSMRLGLIYHQCRHKDVALTRLARWYDEVDKSGFLAFGRVARSIQTHYLEIINFFEKRSTNAASESFNAKIKNFRAQFRGVKDKAFFLYRLTKIYA